MRAGMACLQAESLERSKVPCHVPPFRQAASIQAQGTTWTGKADINFYVTCRSGPAGPILGDYGWLCMSDVRQWSEIVTTEEWMAHASRHGYSASPLGADE
jgi:hypothetical protein